MLLAMHNIPILFGNENLRISIPKMCETGHSEIWSDFQAPTSN